MKHSQTDVSGAASVTAPSVTRSRKSKSAQREPESMFRELVTQPALAHVIRHYKDGITCFDAVPGLVAVGGSFGMALYATTAPPPYPIIVSRSITDLLSSETPQTTPVASPVAPSELQTPKVAALALDPYAPHHRYIAMITTDRAVTVCSTKPGYRYTVTHRLHADPAEPAGRITAWCWTMSLHTALEALPWGGEDPSEPSDDRLADDSDADIPRQPLSASTARCFCALDDMGRVSVLDPAQGVSYVAFRLQAPTGNGGALAAWWSTLSLVAYRRRSRQEVLQHGGAVVGVHILLGAAGVVAFLRCSRSNVGHKLLGPKVTARSSHAQPHDDSSSASKSPVSTSTQGDSIHTCHEAPHIICVSGSDGDAADDALGMALAQDPFSSGAAVVARPKDGRYYVVNGTSGRIVAGLDARTGGGQVVEERRRRRKSSSTIQSHSSSTAHVGMESPLTVACPPYLRSGALRRHVVLRRAAGDDDRRVRVSLLHTPSDAPSTWTVESNPWDAFELPDTCSGIRSPVVLAALLTSDTMSASDLTSDDAAAARLPMTPTLFCLCAEANTVLHRPLPPDIALTPLLEAVLRERYMGIAPAAVTAASYQQAILGTLGRPHPPTTATGNFLRDSVQPDLEAAARWMSSRSAQATTTARTLSGVLSTAVSSASFSLLRRVGSQAHIGGSETDTSGRTSAAASPHPVDIDAQSDVFSLSPESTAHLLRGDSGSVPRKARRQRAVVVYGAASASPEATRPVTFANGDDNDTAARGGLAALHEEMAALQQQESAEVAESDARFAAEALYSAQSEERLLAEMREASDRSNITQDERQTWLIEISGPFETVRDELERQYRRRLSHSHATTARKPAEYYLVMRPGDELLQGDETFLRSVQALQKQVDPAADVTDVVLHQRAPGAKVTVRPGPQLAACLQLEKKLFDVANLRLKQTAEKEALEAKIEVDVIVNEEWRRKSEHEPWAPCPAQYTLAKDGTRVDFHAMLKDASSTSAGASSESVATTRTLGQWTAGGWRYARRWPANALEDANPSFWIDVTAEGLLASGAAAAPPSDCRVRRRIWRTRERDTSVLKQLEELARQHQRQELTLLRSLGLRSEVVPTELGRRIETPLHRLKGTASTS
jgi:hypothetical protein